MNFVAPSTSFTGVGCGAGNTIKAAVTLEKFFFRGGVQPVKQQGVPASYSSKRQCTGCAAAATAKKIRPRPTQLKITKCLPFSPISSCSATQEPSQQAGVAVAAERCMSAPGSSLEQQDVDTNAPTETAGEERCSSRYLKAVQDRENDCEKMTEEDEISENDARGTAGAAAFVSVVYSRADSGELGEGDTSTANATAATDCSLRTEEEGSSDAVRRVTTSAVEPSAVTAGTKAHSKEKAPREAAVSPQDVPEGATTLHNVLRRTQRDTGKPLPCPTATHTAAAATATTVGGTATGAPAPATARSTATAAPGRGTPFARANRTAAVATSFLSTKSASSAAIDCAEGDLSGLVTVPMSKPAVPPVDPEGEPLSDVSQLVRRWRDALGDCWFEELSHELSLPYFVDCLSFVRKERQKHRVFPPAHLLFNAFRTTPLDKIKVVIVGQDPYHQFGQAMGLAFSVPRGIPVPPSLQNIFKEISRNYPAPERLDIGEKPLKAQHGDLTDWAKQGVFLMNTVMTVRENSPLSHKNAGWERFTNKVVNIINTRCNNVVFLLWGKPAQKKSPTLDRQRHLVLEAGHPSPLSVRFFEGCQHFRKCNEYLSSKGKTQIDFSPRT